MNLVPLSQIWTRPFPDSHPVAVRDGEIMTFARFRADVSEAAYRLKDCRRAVLACMDSYYFLVGMYALLNVGADIILPTANQAAILEKAGLRDDLSIDDNFIALPMPGRETASLSALDPLRPAFKFFTSGSTGEPKEVVKNLDQLEKEIASLDKCLGQELGAGPVLATVQHQHLYGLIFRLLWPLASGRTFCAHTHAYWEMLLPEITAGSIIISSPAHLRRLGGIEQLPSTQRPSHVFSAGTVLPFTASKQSEMVFGCIPTEIFGSTETGAIAMRRQKSQDEPWNFLPGITMECDAQNRMVLSASRIGPQPLITQDRVEPLTDGFRFLGRADRIVKIEGIRISLIEVEKALLQLSWVKAATVLALPGDYPQLAAAVVLEPEGKELLEKEGKFCFGKRLRQALSLLQEPMAVPRVWRFIETLPANDMGKICQSELQALFGK